MRGSFNVICCVEQSISVGVQEETRSAEFLIWSLLFHRKRKSLFDDVNEATNSTFNDVDDDSDRFQGAFAKMIHVIKPSTYFLSNHRLLNHFSTDIY